MALVPYLYDRGNRLTFMAVADPGGVGETKKHEIYFHYIFLEKTWWVGVGGVLTQNFKLW